MPSNVVDMSVAGDSWYLESQELSSFSFETSGS